MRNEFDENWRCKAREEEEEKAKEMDVIAPTFKICTRMRAMKKNMNMLRKAH